MTLRVSQGELPFARMARYDDNYLKQMRKIGQLRSFNYGVADKSASVYRKVIFAVPILALAMLFLTLIAVATPNTVSRNP